MRDSFEIWQLKKTDEGIRLLFMDSDFLARHDFTVDLNNYNRVYSRGIETGHLAGESLHAVQSVSPGGLSGAFHVRFRPGDSESGRGNDGVLL